MLIPLREYAVLFLDTFDLPLLSYCMHASSNLMEVLTLRRGVIAWALSSTSMPTSQTSLVEWRPSRTVSACMKKTMESFGSIKIGEVVWQR